MADAGTVVTLPKNVGEVFKLLVGRDPEQRKKLFDVARVTTFAENQLWKIWMKNDPMTATKLVEGRKHKDEHGKWPKTDAYFLGKCADGLSPTKIARTLCPGLHSNVYDAVSNHVRRLYPKSRWQFLVDQKRLPVSRVLRIRFREKAVTLRRDPANAEWFQVGLTFTTGGIEWFPIMTAGVSEHTRRWLRELADSGDHPSGGTISLKEHGRKSKWQIALARSRYPGEVDTVKRPVDGRFLCVWAPIEQDVFLKAQVFPQRGRPWGVSILESDDIFYAKRRYEKQRTTMGRCYAQTSQGAIRGHGRKRRLKATKDFTACWERRVRDWIENRSAWIVGEAVEKKCSLIRFEDLSKRDSSKLRMGTFQYDRLISRTRSKALDAGLEFDEFTDLETITELVA